MIKIRAATSEDAPAITALLDALGYPDTESFIEQRMAQLLAHPDAVLRVAVDGERVVGVILLHFIPQLALPGDFCRISYLCVAETVRSQGVGARLEAHTVQLARERGCDRIELHCHARRADAHRFYLRQQYRESPRYFLKSLR